MNGVIYTKHNTNIQKYIQYNAKIDKYNKKYIKKR